MKIKISRFLRSINFRRIWAVFFAILPLFALGLFALSRSRSKITASALTYGPEDFTPVPWGTLFVIKNSIQIGSTITLPAGLRVRISSSQTFVTIGIWDTDTVEFTDSFHSPSPTAVLGLVSTALPTNRYRGLEIYFSGHSFKDGEVISMPTSVTLTCIISAAGPLLPDPSIASSDLPTVPSGNDISIGYTSLFVPRYYGSSGSVSSKESRVFYIPTPQYELFTSLYNVSVGGASGDELQAKYNEGYSAGYNKGQSDQLVNPVSFLLDPIQTFLDMKLFGKFSIGTALNVILFVSFALIFIKMFAGG